MCRYVFVKAQGWIKIQAQQPPGLMAMTLYSERRWISKISALSKRMILFHSKVSLGLQNILRNVIKVLYITDAVQMILLSGCFLETLGLGNIIFVTMGQWPWCMCGDVRGWEHQLTGHLHPAPLWAAHSANTTAINWVRDLHAFQPARRQNVAVVIKVEKIPLTGVLSISVLASKIIWKTDDDGRKTAVLSSLLLIRVIFGTIFWQNVISWEETRADLSQKAPHPSPQPLNTLPCA